MKKIVRKVRFSRKFRGVRRATEIVVYVALLGAVASACAWMVVCLGGWLG